MKITLEILQKIEPNITANIRANANFKGYPIERLVGYLNTYALEFDITTPGKYRIRFNDESTEGGWHEFLILSCRINTAEIADGIGAATAEQGSSAPFTIFNTSGIKQQSLQPGINIVTMPDGKRRKIILR